MCKNTAIKKDEVISRKIAGERIIVPIRGKLADMQKIFMMNPVADFIWQALEREESRAEIIDGILSRFAVQREQAEADLEEFMVRLLETGLAEEIG